MDGSGHSHKPQYDARLTVDTPFQATGTPFDSTRPGEILWTLTGPVPMSIFT